MNPILKRSIIFLSVLWLGFFATLFFFTEELKGIDPEMLPLMMGFIFGPVILLVILANGITWVIKGSDND